MAEQVNRTIRRTFEVLDYLDARNRPVRLRDVTTDLGYPASSASGVLKSLVVLGYLNYDRDTLSYTLTSRITTLATRPRLLLVDELACGLNPAELERVAARLRALAAEGLGLVVVEHLMPFIDRLTHRVVVMNAGRAIFGGTLREAVRDPQVVEVFLGAPEPVA